MEYIQTLLADYGLWVVLIGTFLEGETIVVLAGFAAHQDLMNPHLVALMAFCGSFVGDQLWFFLARRHRTLGFIVKISERRTFQRALRLLEKYPNIFILSFRFIYGIRNISPVAIGLSDVSALRFFCLNAIAAMVWAATFTTLGYIFANTVESLLGEIKKNEHVILIIAIIAALIFGIHRLVRRKFFKDLDRPN